jgi:hypothetical protein
MQGEAAGHAVAETAKVAVEKAVRVEVDGQNAPQLLVLPAAEGAWGLEGPVALLCLREKVAVEIGNGIGHGVVGNGLTPMGGSTQDRW